MLKRFHFVLICKTLQNWYRWVREKFNGAHTLLITIYSGHACAHTRAHTHSHTHTHTHTHTHYYKLLGIGDTYWLIGLFRMLYLSSTKKWLVRGKQPPYHEQVPDRSLSLSSPPPTIPPNPYRVKVELTYM